MAIVEIPSAVFSDGRERLRVAQLRYNYRYIRTEHMECPEHISSFYNELNCHIQKCEVFNGFTICIAKNTRRGDRRVLRCSCGMEWGISDELWSFRNGGGRDHFDDIIMDLNYRNLEMSRQRNVAQPKKIEKVEKFDKKEVDNAIDELELEV